jgi:hypothetical protein
MPLRQRDRRWAWLGGAGLAAALFVAAFLSWAGLRDRQVAGEVESELVRQLKLLPADDPITRRYGPFLRLEGQGYQRKQHAIGSGWVPIAITRKAVFSKARAHVTILVHPGAAFRVESLKMFPDEASASGLQSYFHEGEIWFPDGTGRGDPGSLFIRAEHPRCPRS